MANRFIYLVRHGKHKFLEIENFDRHPEWSKWKKAISIEDGGLTETGIRQACLTAERLKNFPINRIYTSTLPRTVQTSEYISRALGIEAVKDESLIECIPWTTTEVAEKYKDCMTTKDVNDHTAHADKTFNKFFKPNTESEDVHEVLVCHGNIIRYLTAKLLGMEPDNWINLWINNCSVTTVEIQESGRIRLLSLNDHGHMPKEIIT